MIRALKDWFRNRETFFFNTVLRDRWIATCAASVPVGSRVLDAGAGSCPYKSLFAHCEYKTQDLQPLSKEQLRYGNYGEIDYVCDVTSIPVDAHSFDIVLCTEVLEHHPEPIRVIQEFARILRPGGRLFLTAPLGSGLHQEPYHYYGGYTPFWYQKFLPEAGFKGISIEPNGRSFRFFGQESLRFARTTAPNRLEAPLLIKLIWAPIWLVIAPILAIVMPVVGRWLDQYDGAARFTIGYHVAAVRA